jgi:DNA-binding transcriptional MerR regulator
MNLREMCEALGVSRRTIQGYEEAGLLYPAGKDKYGHLVYDNRSLTRAKKIRYLQEMGFQRKEIAFFIDAPTKELKVALEEKEKEMMAEIKHLQELVETTKQLLKQLENDGLEEKQ